MGDAAYSLLLRSLAPVLQWFAPASKNLFLRRALGSRDPDLEPSALATCQAAAVQGRIPFGDRAGRRENLFGYPLDQPPSPRQRKELCAEHHGYSLHAAVRVGAAQRARLERLARYVARPPLCQDRLSLSRDGRVVYRFRRPWRNGKEAVVLDPMTFLSRLAAQIPPPRFHVVSYYGVLAPAASRRDEIVPAHDSGKPTAQPPGCPDEELPAVAVAKQRRRRPERLP